MDVWSLPDLQDCYVIKASEEKGHEDVFFIYKELIKLFDGRKHISILQDFRKFKATLTMEEFDEIIKLCKVSGVLCLNVATVTHDMSRAFTGVLVQEISDKYGIILNLKYCQDIETAKTWLGSHAGKLQVVGNLHGNYSSTGN